MFGNEICQTLLKLLENEGFTELYKGLPLKILCQLLGTNIFSAIKIVILSVAKIPSYVCPCAVLT